MENSEATPPKITITDRVFRFAESGMTQTLLGIIGGLAGTFLDGRWFMILTPMIPAALHRSKATEGLKRQWSIVILLASCPITAAVLFWCGTLLNKSRPDVLTPADYAVAVQRLTGRIPAITSAPPKSEPPKQSVPSRVLETLSVLNATVRVPKSSGDTAQVILNVKVNGDRPLTVTDFRVHVVGPIDVDAHKQRDIENAFWNNNVNSHGKESASFPLTLPSGQEILQLPNPTEPMTISEDDFKAIQENQKAVYFMYQVRATGGRLLLNYCSHLTSDGVLMLCREHNGP